MTAEACVLSLFAGYGGLDQALEEVLNVRPLYVSDFEAGPSKVLAFRYPDAPNLGDVTKVTWDELTCVRVICGGSPCQDISTAGKRAGMREGTRSNLWVEMRDAIATLRPELVIWENVHAARSADAASALEPCPGCVGGADDAEPVLRALGRVLGDLAELGFDAEWVSVPAAGVGCAHLRWRVFVVAWPADAPSNPRWVGYGDGRAAANAAQLGHERGWEPRDGRDGPQDGRVSPLRLLPSPAVNDMGAGKDIEAWDEWTDKMRAAHSNGNGGHGKSLDIEVRRLLPTPKANDNHHSSPADLERHSPGLRALPQMLPTPRATDGPNQRGSSGDLMLPSAVSRLLPTPKATNNENRQNEDRYGPNLGMILGTTTGYESRWGDYADAIARAEAMFGPAPEPTETDMCACGSKVKSRRLSCRFDEWLMGLPAGWITSVPGVTHAEALKMCGNGVVPAQAALAIRICLDRAMEAAA